MTVSAVPAPAPWPPDRPDASTPASELRPQPNNVYLFPNLLSSLGAPPPPTGAPGALPPGRTVTGPDDPVGALLPDAAGCGGGEPGQQPGPSQPGARQPDAGSFMAQASGAAVGIVGGAPQSQAGIPVMRERCWPGSHPLIAALEPLAVAEQTRLRRRFSHGSGGYWGILYDPFDRVWYGVRGKRYTIAVGTPRELEDWIASGQHGIWRAR
jgi:hypothetical protein